MTRVRPWTWRLGPVLAAAAGAALAAALVAMPGGAQARPPLEPLALALPGVPPPFLAVRAEAAAARGLYARDGLDVSLQPLASAGDALDALLAGQVDAAWVPAPAALAAAAHGAPLVAIEGMDVSDWEIGSSDPQVTTCAELDGQTIGADEPGGPRSDALAAMLASCGLTLADVTTVDFPGRAGMDAQLAGQAPLEVEHADEAAEVEAAGTPVTAVVRLADTDPGELFALLVSTRAEAATRAGTLARLREADAAATAWMRADPVAAATAAAARVGDSPAVTAELVRRDLALGFWPGRGAGLSARRIAYTIGRYRSLGLLPGTRPFSPGSLLDTGLRPGAGAALAHRARTP